MTDRAWVIDLDGVVWRGADVIPGAAAAIAAIRDRRQQVVFVTNSALRTRAQVAEKLARHGIPDAHDDVFTAAMAAMRLVEPGERVLACGAEGLVDELGRRGVEIVEAGPADAVVVGLRLDFDYGLLTAAMRAVRSGARLIATNDDATYPDSDGLLPGNGALVAAVERAGGVASVVAGKPHPPMADLVLEHLGHDVRGVVVGDRPETDGRFAASLGYEFALVLTGVTGVDDLPAEPTPNSVEDDLLSTVESWS
jgi:HAD superfamily hydrolase (TIGR01450 family)